MKLTQQLSGANEAILLKSNKQEKPLTTLKFGEKHQINNLPPNKTLHLIFEEAGGLAKEVLIYQNTQNGTDPQSYTFIWGDDHTVIPLKKPEILPEINEFLFWFGINLKEDGTLELGIDKNNKHGLQAKIAFRLEPNREALKTLTITNAVMPPMPGTDIKSLSGKLEGAGQYAGFSIATCGQNKIPDNLNEDCVGVHKKNKHFIVVDGIASNPCGHIAAHEATRVFLRSKSDELQYKFDDISAGLHKTFEKFRKTKPSLAIPSAVFTAAEIKDNELEIIATGDTPWYLVRKGKIIARYVPHTQSFDKLLMQKQQITEEDILQSMAEPGNNIVTSFTGYPHSCLDEYLEPVPQKPGYWQKAKGTKFQLQDGDRLWLMSDGTKGLFHQDIIAMSQAPLKDGVKMAKEKITAINIKGSIELPFAPNTTPLKAPRDNTSLLGYVHKIPIRTQRRGVQRAISSVLKT